MPTGLVVGGGYSTRFGLAEKGLVRVDGEPMLRRVVRAMAPLVEDVVIDCRADQLPPFRRALAPLDAEPRFAVDPEPDRGPVAGLATGLEAVDAPDVLLASCDRPGLTPAVFCALRRERSDRGVDAAVPTIEGRRQPLCGVFGTTPLLRAVDSARAAGDRRLLGVLEGLTIQGVGSDGLPPDVDPAALGSVDCPLAATLWEHAHGDAANGSRARRFHAPDRLAVPGQAAVDGRAVPPRAD